MEAWAADWNLWGWVIASLILLAAELAMPGIFLVWFGIAALATAAILALSGDLLSLPAQLIIFLILAVCAVLWGRSYFSRQRPNDAPFLNSAIAVLIGKNFRLEEPIIHGEGRLRVNDTIWRLAGPDAPKGSIIRITGYDSGALTAALADKA